jgi:hypothetical protein
MAAQQYAKAASGLKRKAGQPDSAMESNTASIKRYETLHAITACQPVCDRNAYTETGKQRRDAPLNPHRFAANEELKGEDTQAKYGQFSQQEVDKLSAAVRQYAESNNLSTTDYRYVFIG